MPGLPDGIEPSLQMGSGGWGIERHAQHLGAVLDRNGNAFNFPSQPDNTLPVIIKPRVQFYEVLDIDWDRDGDGKAEVRERLFTGFGNTIFERSINNPRWGLDNWIYVAGGNKGETITGPHLKKGRLKKGVWV